MRCHVQTTVASCFAVLCQLRSIRRSVPTSVYQRLVVTVVLSRLDYGSAVPGYLYNRLQSVLNAPARSIAGLRRSDHVTDTLASFHWLRAPERVQFKLATIVFPGLRWIWIYVWISDLSHPVDIMLAHLLIKLATYMLCLSRTFPRLSFLVFIFSFIYVI